MNELTHNNSVMFCINGNEYVFDGIHYETIRMNPTEKDIFTYMTENRKYPTNKEWVKALYPIVKKVKQGYFFTEKKVTFYGMQESKDYIVSFPIVHSCNLRCKYCFADGGDVYKGTKRENDKETIDGILKSLMAYSNEQIDSVRLEFVSGGETFLKPDKFRDIVDHITEKLHDMQIPLTVFALTNGTILNPTIAQYVREKGLHLGISLDGDKETQDNQRPYADGRPTYDDVVRNIHALTEDGKQALKNVWVVSVITAKTKSLEQLLAHHKTFGLSSMEMRVVRGKDPYGLSMTEDTIAHFERLYLDFAEYLKKNPMDILYIMNQYDTFGKILYRYIAKEKNLYRCQAGRTKFSFTAEGDIYPCDSFVGIEEMRIGNIKEPGLRTEILTQFKDHSVDANKRCMECNYRYLCGGDCYYNQYVKQSDADRDLYCRFQILLMQLAIDLAWDVKEHHPQVYDILENLIRIRSLQKGKSDSHGQQDDH